MSDETKGEVEETGYDEEHDMEDFEPDFDVAKKKLKMY